MAQVWILAAQVAPHDAVRSGADVAVCGGCALRGRYGKARVCYVQVHQAPLTVWRTWQAGGYHAATTPAAQQALGRQRDIRLGAYGDPAAVPLAVWDALLQDARGWTGYTHQWRNPRFAGLARYCVASCETEAQVVEATARGFGTFRVLTTDAPTRDFEVACPSALGVQCLTCQRCAGPGNHITIPAHGRGAKWLADGKISRSRKDLIVLSGDFGAHTA